MHEELKEIKDTVDKIARCILEENELSAMYFLGMIYERLEALEQLPN